MTKIKGKPSKTINYYVGAGLGAGGKLGRVVASRRQARGQHGSARLQRLKTRGAAKATKHVAAASLDSHKLDSLDLLDNNHKGVLKGLPIMAQFKGRLIPGVIRHLMILIREDLRIHPPYG
jgi:hypothetical protein